MYFTLFNIFIRTSTMEHIIHLWICFSDNQWVYQIVSHSVCVRASKQLFCFLIFVLFFYFERNEHERTNKHIVHMCKCNLCKLANIDLELIFIILLSFDCLSAASTLPPLNVCVCVNIYMYI